MKPMPPEPRRVFRPLLTLLAVSFLAMLLCVASLPYTAYHFLVLDFTWSPYLASYFALEDGRRAGDRAVWALQLDARPAHAGQPLAHVGRLAAFVAREFGDAAGEALRSGAFWEDGALVDAFLAAAEARDFRALVAVTTDRMNARMPSSLGAGFIAYRGGADGGDRAAAASLVKLVLPRSAHRDALADLLRMNITRVSLFPGLEGFARTLGDNLERALENRPGDPIA